MAIFRFNLLSRLRVFVIVLFCLAGCSTAFNTDNQSGLATGDSSTESYVDRIRNASELPELQGFDRYDFPNGGALYVAKNVALEGYDNFMVIDPTFQFVRRQVRLTANEWDSLRETVYYAGYNQINDIGFDLVNAASDCTVTGQLHFHNLRLFKSGSSSSQVNYVKSLGSSDLVGEFKDAKTNATLYLVVSRMKLGGGTTKSGSPSLNRVGSAVYKSLDHMFRNFISLLDFDSEKVDSRNELGCTGEIGMKWQRLLEVPVVDS